MQHLKRPLSLAQQLSDWMEEISKYQYSIFSDCQRKTTHYATIVGISYDHYKLQNSWGRKWGERGYIRVNAGDTCGICLRGSYPIMKEE